MKGYDIDAAKIIGKNKYYFKIAISFFNLLRFT